MGLGRWPAAPARLVGVFVFLIRISLHSLGDRNNHDYIIEFFNIVPLNEFLIYRNLGCLDCQGNGRLDLHLYS